jgi:AraC family transcriptional regulator
MELYIKNMVCDRCILIVRQEVEKVGLQVKDIALGKVALNIAPSPEQLQELTVSLQAQGFQLIDKQRNQLVEQVKNKVIERVHHAPLHNLTESLTQLVAKDLNKEYAYLSRLFSEVEGITVEKYVIQQKVEKVKELLEYGELNLNEIAFKMGYSSSAHLSTQFKSVTGMTPSHYKATTHHDRKPLDQVN